MSQLADMAEKLTNEDGTPELEFCNKHQGKIADMYCIKCTTGVCSLCLCHGKGQHVGHMVTTLEEWCSRLKVSYCDVLCCWNNMVVINAMS